MANNPRAFDPRAREARQQAWLAVPTVAEQFPGVGEIAVELQFLLENGRPHSSAHRRIFLPDMQAYFDVQCPDRDCSDGGFDLGRAIQAAARAPGHSSAGNLRCRGFTRSQPCSLSLEYGVLARPQPA
ncbi:MAG: hypothetical protein AB1651_02350 [Pseudomonadota bacterium]